MATPATSTYISKAIAENKIVTFRLLSRELSMHVNEAKNQLAAYHATALSGSQPVFATFLVSGDVPVALPGPQETSQSTESTQPEATDESNEMERRIMLAGEQELDAVKSQFARIASVHIYSVSPSVLKDVALLTTPSAAVRAIDGKRGLDHAQRVGMLIAPDVKWTVSKTTMPPPKNQPLKVKNASSDPVTKSSSEPQAAKKLGTLDWSKAKTKQEKITLKTPKEESPAPQKTASVDTIKPKGKDAPPKASADGSSSTSTAQSSKDQPKSASSVTVKAEPSSARPAFKQQTTARPASKQESTAKPTLKAGSTARPASKQLSTARPASKQSSDIRAIQSGSKRPTPPKDEDDEVEEEISRGRNVKQRLDSDTEHSSRRTSASSSASQLSKGRLVTSDEEEEEEAPVKRPAAKKRKSQARPVDDEEEEEEAVEGANKRSRLLKGTDAAEERRKAKARVTKELEDLVLHSADEDAHMTDGEDRDQGDVEDEEEEEVDNGEPPEHVPHTKPIRGMPKKPKKEVATGIDAPKEKKRKTKAPLGSNGRPKKRVMKSRMVKMEKGFMKTEDYSSYESDNDSDSGSKAEEPIKKKPAKAKPTVKSENTDAEDSSKAEPKPKPRASTGGAGTSKPKTVVKKKSASGGTLNSYFRKK